MKTKAAARMFGLTKRGAFLEAGKINAAGGNAAAYYDRVMAIRGGTRRSRNNWAVQINRKAKI